MRDDHRILDADRHVIEPVEMWEEYIEPEFRGRTPYLAQSVSAEPPEARTARLGVKALLPPAPVMMLDGQTVCHELDERTQVELTWLATERLGLLAMGANAEAQLAAMDASGIDVACLYPSFAMHLMGIESLELARASAFARAYNRWLQDYCATAPARLRGVGLIALHDPAQALAELGRIVDRGWTAAVVRPTPHQQRTLADPAYEPFWTACEAASVAVGIHDVPHTRSPTAGADRFRSHFARSVSCHSLEMMMALLSLIDGGVLEHHPALRVGFFEAGCGWVPYWLWRMDELYARMAGEVSEHVRRAPSEYFRRQCFVTLEPGEPGLTEVVRCIGDDNLLFGTDFPHLDQHTMVVEEVLALRASLPETTLRKVLWDNPARFYGLRE